MVSTSWALLNESERMSNVPDGITLVEKRSSPCANTSEVDSSNAAEVTIEETPTSWDHEHIISESPYRTKGRPIRVPIMTLTSYW